MDKYYYRIYGIAIASNIEMPLLPQVSCSSEDETVELIIKFGQVKNNGISVISASDDCVLIMLNNYANYTLSVKVELLVWPVILKHFSPLCLTYHFQYFSF